MSDTEDKRYCTVDHADKQGERKAKNPNRLKLTRERIGRWVVAEPTKRGDCEKGGGE